MMNLQSEKQARMDDGAGLRVAHARFIGESKFAWSLFSGYDSMRALTYSSSIPAIVRMLADYEFERFECVFGCEHTLRDIKPVLAFQQVAVGDTRAAIKGLGDARMVDILRRVSEGKAEFRVLREQIAHAKVYLLENAADGKRLVLIGSANLSEAAFSGLQPETLVKFDDDELAWAHYSTMYNIIRDEASDKIALPSDQIGKAEIELAEIPALSGNAGTLVIHSVDSGEGLELVPTFDAQVKRIERVAAATNPLIAAVVPPFRKGVQRITPQVKQDLRQIRLVKSADEADNRRFSINRAAGEASLDDEEFSMEFNAENVYVRQSGSGGQGEFHHREPPRAAARLQAVPYCFRRHWPSRFHATWARRHQRRNASSHERISGIRSLYERRAHGVPRRDRQTLHDDIHDHRSPSARRGVAAENGQPHTPGHEGTYGEPLPALPRRGYGETGT